MGKFFFFEKNSHPENPKRREGEKGERKNPTGASRGIPEVTC